MVIIWDYFDCERITARKARSAHRRCDPSSPASVRLHGVMKKAIEDGGGNGAIAVER